MEKKMQVDLYLYRFSDNGKDTLGLLMFNNELLCYTLEDEHRAVKVDGETRIPEGIYEIKLRTTGGFHQKYLKKFGKMHKGMLHLQDVPGFEYILIHCGNSEADTAGCILLGNTANNNKIENGFIQNSVKAYKRIYPIIADLLVRGVKVNIHIKDEYHFRDN
jgi:hypothetical protein